jgi:hypothetical protein
MYACKYVSKCISIPVATAPRWGESGERVYTKYIGGERVYTKYIGGERVYTKYIGGERVYTEHICIPVATAPRWGES